MKNRHLIIVVLATLLVSPVQAFDLGAMLKDAVREKTEEAVQKSVDKANEALKEAFPSLPEGAISIDSEQLGVAKKDVVLYETKSCPYCKKARDFFKSNKVAYKSRDVGASEAAQKEFKDLGGRGVPMILVKDKRLTGWNESKLRGMLKEAGYL